MDKITSALAMVIFIILLPVIYVIGRLRNGFKDEA